MLYSFFNMLKVGVPGFTQTLQLLVYNQFFNTKCEHLVLVSAEIALMELVESPVIFLVKERKYFFHDQAILSFFAIF